MLRQKNLKNLWTLFELSKEEFKNLCLEAQVEQLKKENAKLRNDNTLLIEQRDALQGRLNVLRKPA